MTLTAILKTFIEPRGFGFFATNEGDVFAHMNEFRAAHLTPEVGKQYRFRVIENPRNSKPMATDIAEANDDDTTKQEVELAWLSHQQQQAKP